MEPIGISLERSEKLSDSYKSDCSSNGSNEIMVLVGSTILISPVWKLYDNRSVSVREGTIFCMAISGSFEEDMVVYLLWCVLFCIREELPCSLSLVHKFFSPVKKYI